MSAFGPARSNASGSECHQNVSSHCQSPSVRARHGLWDRERHRLPALRAPSEYVVVSVDQLDKHLVLTGRYSGQVDCIDTTRVRPQPRQVVEVYV
jgi:hypothetical protein